MPLHLCVAGPGASDNWDLIRILKDRHHVTLMKRMSAAESGRVLAAMDVLALDCSADAVGVLDLVPILRRIFPHLVVVVLDGGLSQHTITNAFTLGVDDYFSDPYDPPVIAERVENLARLKRAERV